MIRAPHGRGHRSHRRRSRRRSRSRTSRPAAVIPAAVQSPAALPVPPRAGRTAPIWWIGVLVLVLVVLVGYFLSAIGPAASIIGMLLALVPLAGVLVAVRLVDRWEPEPWSLLAFAVAWGAIVAVGIALGIDLLITTVFGVDDSPAREAFTAIVQAPIVEEFAKGLGVFVIFVSARRAFDGPIDGIVYGGLIGAGFAFTENIQYFAISFIEGGVADVSTTFFVRGILSPFAHVMFTSVTGFALGLAARRGARPRQAVGPWVLGMIGAIALHAFWNGSAVFLELLRALHDGADPALRPVHPRRHRTAPRGGATDPHATVRLRRGRMVHRCRRSTCSRPRRAGRRRSRWARTLRGDRTPLMKRFILDATALAAARQRAITGRDARAAEDEQILLARTADARAGLFAP